MLNINVGRTSENSFGQTSMLCHLSLLPLVAVEREPALQSDIMFCIQSMYVQTERFIQCQLKHSLLVLPAAENNAALLSYAVLYIGILMNVYSLSAGGLQSVAYKTSQ